MEQSEPVPIDIKQWKGTPRNISDLSDELLLEICNFINERPYQAGEGHQQRFSRLVLVNRRFNRIATPFLYAHYCQSDGAIFADLSDSRPHAPYVATLFMFLRTIAEVPELAHLTKQVTFRCRPGHGQYMTLNSLGLPVGEQPGVLAKFNQKLFPVAEYEEEFLRGDGQVRLAVMLTHMPNLNDLTLSLNDPPHRWSEKPPERYPWHALFDIERDEILGNTYSFNKLQRLKIQFGTRAVGDLWPFFRLPALLTLELEAEGYPRPASWDCPAGTSPIKYLRIDDDEAKSGSALIPMISSCKALSSFKYKASDPWHDPHFDLELSLLVSALEKHATSLEKLVALVWAGHGSRRNYVGSLEGLHKLKSLRISLHVLVPQQGQQFLLPKSLRDLEVLQSANHIPAFEGHLQRLRAACIDQSIRFREHTNRW
ncbi:hypothetical protein BU16DRAFT_619407 [Lophium mytilinum]|uniref:F-box domain-containing protein n=1 Tax=Lophium mytilinum TaxID=390894 RepID=A0A6A6QQF8_9PEZI|nr:hypothetical protein BU16DRAFT_619407 [Lophium mytilinum]